MKKKGVKWIFISSIDNILLKIADTTLIGLAIEKNTQIATKSIIRNSPEEKVGAILHLNIHYRTLKRQIHLQGQLWKFKIEEL